MFFAPVTASKKRKKITFLKILEIKLVRWVQKKSQIFEMIYLGYVTSAEDVRRDSEEISAVFGEEILREYPQF